MLRPGDAVVIGADVVHATFNDTAEPARILAILSPAVEGDGYAAVDVSTEEPWASLALTPAAAHAAPAGRT